MKYQIIVIDPPWQVKKIQNKQRPNQVEMDYPMMSIAEIKALPIEKIADESSYCFLWTTQKYLWESKAILEGWGFNHKLTMVWEKTYGRSAGMALYGFRWNAEFILVGTKGKKDMFPKTKLIPAVFQAENIRHSQKPDRFIVHSITSDSNGCAGMCMAGGDTNTFLNDNKNLNIFTLASSNLNSNYPK